MQQTRPEDPASAVPPGAAPGERDAVAEAARGYWRRRGLPTGPEQVVTAPTAPLLLAALLAAACADGARGPGGVVLPRPGPAWHADQVRLLGLPSHPVPVPADCGGAPDPFALLEAVGRARAAGGDPRVLLLSVADGLTGTAAPPELLHEVCEAAEQEGLLVVSDESWRDTAHDPRGTVLAGPAEILHCSVPYTARGTRPGPGPLAVAHPRPLGGGNDSVVVLVDPGTALDAAPGTALAAAPAAARLPAGDRGRHLGAGTRAALAALHARPRGPAAAAAAEACGEPEGLRGRRAAANRLHGALAAALHRALTAAGAVCRRPGAGRHLYPDFEPLRPALAARGITDAPGLEAELVRRLGPYAAGGHRFGDDPRALRVRLSTGLLARGAPAGAAPPGPGAGPSGPPDPPSPGDRAPGVPGHPGTAAALAALATALDEMAAGGPGAAAPAKSPDTDGSPV
ncbi:aminotransferase class I/II-fold pyridoxal phosphate-dependent enzyme [Streptomyces desertarenae]|uniref:Aminotransferase class I/II-fold pyridoxal phosphate-dependent enzyme n=1 Tax=Streptomyces desertarenae TaxID=2666184 RepID=A0ABW4PL38_9ACTN